MRRFVKPQTVVHAQMLGEETDKRFVAHHHLYLCQQWVRATLSQKAMAAAASAT